MSFDLYKHELQSKLMRNAIMLTAEGLIYAFDNGSKCLINIQRLPSDKIHIVCSKVYFLMGT